MSKVNKLLASCAAWIAETMETHIYDASNGEAPEGGDSGPALLAEIKAYLDGVTIPPKPSVKVSAKTEAPTFDGFNAMRREAIAACAAEHGPRWDLRPHARVDAYLPTSMARYKGRLTGAVRKSTRDMPLPAPRYWPNGIPAAIYYTYGAQPDSNPGGTEYTLEDIAALGPPRIPTGKAGDWRYEGCEHE